MRWNCRAAALLSWLEAQDAENAPDACPEGWGDDDAARQWMDAEEAENAPASSSAAAGEGTTRGRPSSRPDPFGPDCDDPFPEGGDDDDQGSIYSRMWFDIPGADGVSEMTVRGDYDDAFILWINGMEVVRANVGTDDSGLNWDHDPTSHESTNKPGPDATRWAEPVSNLFGAGDDNPNGAIVDFTFAVAFNPVTAVEAKGKLATVWGDLRK